MLTAEIVDSASVGAIGIISRSGAAGGEADIGSVRRIDHIVADLEALARTGDITEVMKECGGTSAHSQVVRVSFERLR